MALSLLQIPARLQRFLPGTEETSCRYARESKVLVKIASYADVAAGCQQVVPNSDTEDNEQQGDGHVHPSCIASKSLSRPFPCIVPGNPNNSNRCVMM
jgi:hypothetical protein